MGHAEDGEGVGEQHKELALSSCIGFVLKTNQIEEKPESKTETTDDQMEILKRMALFLE